MSAELLQQRLQRHASRKIPWRQKLTRSAVATVLYVDTEGNAEVLLMQRASRDGDPWSGHISYPGGRMQDNDSNPIATAEREMLEEVGLDIRQSGKFVARLSDVITREHSRMRPMVVTPYVYFVDSKPATTNSIEATSSFWCPLNFFADRNNRERMTWPVGGSKLNVPLSMPCYYYQQKRIWGLTLLMLDELVSVATGAGNSHYDK